MQLNHILAIIKKDADIDLRQKYAVGGILLFVVTVAYLIYKTFNQVVAMEWNILLWLVLLFAGLNAVVKSFVQEKSGAYLYYYTLFDSTEVILAKLLYNFLFVLILFSMLVAVFSILLGYPIKDNLLFYSGAFFGSLGISSVFTFVSAVASTENSNSTMMSIMALPLVLPVMLLLQRITSVAMRLIQDSDIYTDLWMLAGIDLLLMGLAIIIFPMLWKS